MKKLLIIALLLAIPLLAICPREARAAIVPLFEDRSFFSEGLAAVKLNGKWGFIEPSGIWAVIPQYTEENGFDEMNKNGELGFSEERLPIKIKEKWGFLNTLGEMAIEPLFDEVRPFSNGLAAVAVNKKWGYVDTGGKIAISPQFDFGGPFREETALVMTDKGTATVWAPWLFVLNKARLEYAYIDKTGKVLIPGPFDDVNLSYWYPYGPAPKRSLALMAAKQGSFSGGLAGIRTKAGLLAYIDKQGRQVLKFGKDIVGLSPFQNGTAALKDLNGKILVIDQTGKVITGPHYISLGKFSSEGLAAAAERKNKYGFVNASYRFVILPQFEEAGSFQEGMAPVKLDGKWKYIGATGQEANGLRFEAASEFRSGVAFVKLEGKYALINTKFESLPVRFPLENL